jgi:argininosuccinate synthase
MGTVSFGAAPLHSLKDRIPRATIFSIVASSATISNAYSLSTELTRRLVANPFAQQSQYSHFANADATRPDTAAGPPDALPGPAAGL